MQKIFYLKTCGTCTKIMNKFDLSYWELRELKSTPVTKDDLAQMYAHTKSYESLFSRRSTQIKTRNIDVKALTEKNFRDLILDHYSFLKRTVFLTNNEIFIGNEKKNIVELEQFFKTK